MIIILDNGFFKFYPEKTSEITKMSQILNCEFMQYKNYWIPKKVYDLKDTLFVKGDIINNIPLEHSADNIEDLFHKNDLTYNFLQKNIAKISIISNNNNVGYDIYALTSLYLIEAGSFVEDIKVKNYYCRYDFYNFYYTGVSE